MASDGGRLSDLRVVVVAVPSSVDDHLLVVHVLIVAAKVNLCFRTFICDLAYKLS